MAEESITVVTNVKAPIERVWEYWTAPERIINWAYASDDWEAPYAENDLRVGGKFKTRMQARDRSEGFDFDGTYTAVEPYRIIEYDMSDGRHVKVEFIETSEGTQVIERFDSEKENTAERQRFGWQAILNNFKKYTEGQYWVDRLRSEGYVDVQVCPLPGVQDMPEHTHDLQTVHVILDGDLIIIDGEGEKVFGPGNRIEFVAGTTHKARGSIANGAMVTGVKK